MHGTAIRWAYYCIFRAANAPDLGKSRQNRGHMGSQSAHILRMLGTPLAKDLPGLIFHQHAQSNDFWLRGATRTSFLAIGVTHYSFLHEDSRTGPNASTLLRRTVRPAPPNCTRSSYI